MSSICGTDGTQSVASLNDPIFSVAVLPTVTHAAVIFYIKSKDCRPGIH